MLIPHREIRLALGGYLFAADEKNQEQLHNEPRPDIPRMSAGSYDALYRAWMAGGVVEGRALRCRWRFQRGWRSNWAAR